MGPRIVLASVGSYGDLHPFIAVAQELGRRGFDPVIAASEAYRKKVEGSGVAFHPVRPSPAQLLEAGLDEAALAQAVLRSGTVSLIDLTVLPYLEQSYADMAAVMQGASAVLASSFAIPARLAAQKAGLPVVSVLLSPVAFFSAQDPPLLMELPWLQGFHRRFGARAMKAVLDLGRAHSRRRTRAITALRKRLSLPAVSGDEIIDGPLRAGRIAALYSPVLGPLPADAPPNSAIFGFTFHDSEHGGPAALSPELERFLSAGPQPLVFTLGSLAVRAAGDFYEQSAEVAKRLNRRAVLLVGRHEEARLSAQLASPDIHVTGYAPHSLLFPRAAACIHHGGIGAVAQALRAGRPQLIHPLCGDQADNAQRLTRLGVARSLGAKRFTADQAAPALSELTQDPKIAAWAAALSLEVAREDGARSLVDTLTSGTGSPMAGFVPRR